eukprot:Hpha_TRINITY_DN3161_c0_g1::TRINITY_DN3161_c0_g1_i1::g.96571::m.96571
MPCADSRKPATERILQTPPVEGCGADAPPAVNRVHLLIRRAQLHHSLPARLGVLGDLNAVHTVSERLRREPGESQDLTLLLETVGGVRVLDLVERAGDDSRIIRRRPRGHNQVPLSVVDTRKHTVHLPLQLRRVVGGRLHSRRLVGELQNTEEIGHVDIVHECRGPHPVPVQVPLLTLKVTREHRSVSSRCAGVGLEVVLHPTEPEAPLDTLLGLLPCGVLQQVRNRDLGLDHPRGVGVGGGVRRVVHLSVGPNLVLETSELRCVRGVQPKRNCPVHVVVRPGEGETHHRGALRRVGVRVKLELLVVREVPPSRGDEELVVGRAVRAAGDPGLGAVEPWILGGYGSGG